MELFEKPFEILKILEDNGFEGYLVGGCVRDFLLKRQIHDWDMTTSATPEEMMSIFPKTVPTGIAHGTVTILHGGETFEATTFRSDGDYQDNRHPDQVSFVKSLSEDLGRRDFTINAMALDRHLHLTDLWDGQKDLEQKIIRTVGNPEKRFQEDALRILRAYRFSAQLGFSLEEATKKATVFLAHRCHSLSAERIRDEIEKTITSPAPQQLNLMVEIGLLTPYFPAISVNFHQPTDKIGRWAQVLKSIPGLDLKKLRLSNHTIQLATAVATAPPITSLLDFKYFLSKNSLEAGKILAQLTNTQAYLEIIQAENYCYSLSQLAVTGRDFPHLSGRAIGQTLNHLLAHVLTHPEDNTKEILLNL